MKTKTKICFKCKKEKPLLKFILRKSGKNKGRYDSYCHECIREYQQLPWNKIASSVRQRCKDKKTNYYKRGIKYLMTPIDIKKLWFRDKAWLLKHPSFDRKNNDGNYTYSNCRFIELKLNQSLGGKIGAEMTNKKIRERKLMKRIKCLKCL